MPENPETVEDKRRTMNLRASDRNDERPTPHSLTRGHKQEEHKRKVIVMEIYVT